MIQNIYGASPFEEVIEKWNSVTEQVRNSTSPKPPKNYGDDYGSLTHAAVASSQINMGAIVAAKKFTKLWKKKAKASREKR